MFRIVKFLVSCDKRSLYENYKIFRNFLAVICPYQICQLFIKNYICSIFPGLCLCTNHFLHHSFLFVHQQHFILMMHPNKSVHFSSSWHHFQHIQIFLNNTCFPCSYTFFHTKLVCKASLRMAGNLRNSSAAFETLRSLRNFKKLKFQDYWGNYCARSYQKHLNCCSPKYKKQTEKLLASKLGHFHSKLRKFWYLGLSWLKFFIK